METSETERRRRPARTPTFLISGFLGAGKTTLLNRLLKDPGLADTLVLVGEFGDVALDHLLIDRIDGDMVFLSSGCACCALRGDFVDSLERILRDLDNGRRKPFARLVIETSGLSDPAPLIHTLTAHPYLAARLDLSAIVTVVDALTGLQRIEDFDEALRQVVVADQLAIAKTDLLSEDQAVATADLYALLRRLNPGAELVDLVRDEPCAAKLFDLRRFDLSQKPADLARWLRAEQFAAPMRAAARLAGAHESADAIARRRGVASLSLCSDQALSPSAADAFFAAALARYGSHILRLKGLVRLSDDPERPMVAHGVQHIMHPTIRLDAWPDSDRRTRIVFILKDLDPKALERLWRGYAGLADPRGLDRLIDPTGVARGGLFS